MPREHVLFVRGSAGTRAWQGFDGLEKGIARRRSVMWSHDGGTLVITGEATATPLDGGAPEQTETIDERVPLAP